MTRQLLFPQRCTGKVKGPTKKALKDAEKENEHLC